MDSIICGKKTVFSICALDFSDMEGLLYALTHDILYKGHGNPWILVSVGVWNQSPTDTKR